MKQLALWNVNERFTNLFSKDRGTKFDAPCNQFKEVSPILCEGNDALESIEGHEQFIPIFYIGRLIGTVKGKGKFCLFKILVFGDKIPSRSTIKPIFINFSYCNSNEGTTS